MAGIRLTDLHGETGRELKKDLKLLLITITESPDQIDSYKVLGKPMRFKLQSYTNRLKSTGAFGAYWMLRTELTSKLIKDKKIAWIGEPSTKEPLEIIVDGIQVILESIIQNPSILSEGKRALTAGQTHGIAGAHGANRSNSSSTIIEDVIGSQPVQNSNPNPRASKWSLPSTLPSAAQLPSRSQLPSNQQLPYLCTINPGHSACP